MLKVHTGAKETEICGKFLHFSTKNTYCAFSDVLKKLHQVGVFSSNDPNSQVNSELRAPGSKQAEMIRQAAIFGMSRLLIF